MADEVQAFAVTIPAGTPKSANFSAPLAMPARVVERLQVRVPPGPRGEVGFAIGAAGQPILPVNAGTFIVTDNEVFDWALENQIDSGGWSFFGYNTGIYPHTITIRFLVRMPQRARVAVGGGPIAPGDLAPPGGPGPVPPPPSPPPLGPPPAPPPPLPLPPPPLPTPPALPGPPGQGPGPARYLEDTYMVQEQYLAPGEVTAFPGGYIGPLQVAGVQVTRSGFVEAYTDLIDGPATCTVTFTALNQAGVFWQQDVAAVPSQMGGIPKISGPSGWITVAVQNKGRQRCKVAVIYQDN